MDQTEPARPEPTSSQRRARRFGRVVQVLFWIWQGLYGVVIAGLMLGQALDAVRPWPDAGAPFLRLVYLLPVLLPAWLPVTVMLGVLLLLTRRLAQEPADEREGQG